MRKLFKRKDRKGGKGRERERTVENKTGRCISTREESERDTVMVSNVNIRTCVFFQTKTWERERRRRCLFLKSNIAFVCVCMCEVEKKRERGVCVISEGKYRTKAKDFPKTIVGVETNYYSSSKKAEEEKETKNGRQRQARATRGKTTRWCRYTKEQIRTHRTEKEAEISF